VEEEQMILEEKFKEWLKVRHTELIESKRIAVDSAQRYINLGQIFMIEEIQKLLEFDDEDVGEKDK
jgi:hypothetical protein